MPKVPGKGDKENSIQALADTHCDIPQNRPAQPGEKTLAPGGQVKEDKEDKVYTSLILTHAIV